MRGATLMLLLLVGIGVLVPAASLGQSAGDEQYVDPFQNQEDQGGSGGGGGGQATGGGQTDSGTGTSGESGAAGGTTGAAPPPPEEGGGFGASASGSSASSSGTLPRTGLPAALVALLGTALLAGGAALRRGV